VTTDFEAQIAGVAALHEPVRRSLYQFVASSPDPVSRDQAAAAVGVQRSLAAFHLDKLAEEGMIEVEFRRLTDRSGPGAGRPAKLYRRSDRQIDISLPSREYDLAGRLLAEAIESADRSSRSVRAELGRASRAFGRTLGAQVMERAGKRASPARQRAALRDVLAEHGFEPRFVDGGLVLANCPFHTLARQFTDLVCGMNLHLMEGLRSELRLGEQDLQPRLEPEPGQCCVKLCTFV
jgi:predicted ArsR family transcriptional regulator